MSWRQVHVGRRGDPLRIGDHRVWQEEWRWLDSATVHLPDPGAPAETLAYMICEVGGAQHPARFAAAKLPSGLWCFYVPD